MLTYNCINAQRENISLNIASIHFSDWSKKGYATCFLSYYINIGKKHIVGIETDYFYHLIFTPSYINPKGFGASNGAVDVRYSYGKVSLFYQYKCKVHNNNVFEFRPKFMISNRNMDEHFPPNGYFGRIETKRDYGLGAGLIIEKRIYKCLSFSVGCEYYYFYDSINELIIRGGLNFRF